MRMSLYPPKVATVKSFSVDKHEESNLNPVARRPLLTSGSRTHLMDGVAGIEPTSSEPKSDILTDCTIPQCLVAHRAQYATEELVGREPRAAAYLLTIHQTNSLFNHHLQSRFFSY